MECISKTEAGELFTKTSGYLLKIPLHLRRPLFQRAHRMLEHEGEIFIFFYAIIFYKIRTVREKSYNFVAPPHCLLTLTKTWLVSIMKTRLSFMRVRF